MTLILVHLFLGVMLKYSPMIVTLAYPVFFILFMIDVLRSRDSGSRAGFYALHLVGYEMVYRMAGASLSWEMGKYISIILLLFGLFVGSRKYIPWIFIFLLILLLPSVFLAEHSDTKRLTSMIMFNISGPLSLVVSCLYFFKRRVFQRKYFHQLKLAFLPAFTIVAALSVVANLATVEFTSVQSSAGASGGFGPNQVSTILGWFIMLALLYKINGQKITPFKWLDWLMLFYLVLRALLTFSRGGVLGSVLALLGSILVLYFSYSSFRKQLFASLPYVIFSLLFFAGVFIYANKLTNNYLLYRYQGLSTSEAISGVRSGNTSVLTGRDEIMKADFHAFIDYPILGVGYGMAEKYRLRYYGQAAAAHTEFTRLLAEHGTLGALFMLIGMLIMPIYFFFTEKGALSRCFFIAFYLLSMFTMFHAAMRLAMPGIIFGAAFMRLLPDKTEKIKFIEEVK